MLNGGVMPVLFQGGLKWNDGDKSQVNFGVILLIVEKKIFMNTAKNIKFFPGDILFVGIMRQIYP